MIITGTNGDDTGWMALRGTGDVDIINGLAGNDELYGGRGNDILVGGPGNDLIDGGAGIDLVSYAGAQGSQFIWLPTGLHSSTDGSHDQLVDIENVWGSEQYDNITGTDGVNLLSGRGGDDYLDGGFGGDRLAGGDGRDFAGYTHSSAAVTIDLGAGIVVGGDADGDVLSSIENLDGSAFADHLTGNGVANTLVGEAGVDVLKGAGGADRLLGCDGQDQLWGGKGADVFAFYEGDSAATKADADVIKDFHEAQGDKIDLSSFDVLEFIGSNAFTGPDQARVTTSGGNTYVAINESGSGTAEMVIRLDGLHSLEQTDFIF